MTLQILEQSGHEGVPDAFAQLPAQIYANEPMWIPEQAQALAASFSADNPWFERGQARTHAGLGAPQGLGCPGHRAEPGDGDERA